MHQDLVFDQFAQNAQTQTGGLLVAERLSGARGLVLEILFDIGTVNLLPVNTSGHIVAGRLKATGGRESRYRKRQQKDKGFPEIRGELQVFLHSKLR